MRATVLLLLAALALPLGACGGDHSGHGNGAAGGSGPRSVDRAFIAAMVPHHESAVAMAELALEQAETDDVRALAKDIVRSQQAEIDVLREVETELQDVRPGDLGVPEDAMGMSHDAASIDGADPFDRAFVDEMVPHHQGAIAMAEAQLARGEHPRLRQLAQAIIAAQRREIEAMNAFRQRTYGAPVPSSADDGGHGSGHSG